ncbi:MAG: ribosome-associated translation inhibitor RaiA [bacterium]
MRLIVNGRNIEITTAIREYTEEKIGRVARHYDQINELEVTLSVVKNPSVQKNHIAEVTCSLNGARAHLTEEAETMYASIDLLADKLDRQVKKHKEKLLKGKSGSASIRTDNNLPEEAEEEEVEESIDAVEE